MITLYNSLSRTKEPLPDQKKIRLFVCGPTVYDYLHIGNARTYIFFDFFARYLRSQGYEVDYIENITDIDDKIIIKAAQEKKDPALIAKFFTNAFLEDMRALGVTGVTKYAPATEFIAQIVAQVERLVDKEFAYKIEGDGWYFDIAKDPDYGKLSGRTIAQAEDGVSRIDESIGKRNKGDFCLWKFSMPGEASWPSSLGAGRPGWHIEDTAISEFFFGPQYEIHGGGVDLKFPHHEAEIAQQESASGLTPFVKIWMHTGALLMEGKKMSKSLGNSLTIREFLAANSAATLRWIVFSHEYKSPLDFSEQTVSQARAELSTILSFYGKLIYQRGNDDHGEGHALSLPDITRDTEEFDAHLAHDVNTRAAIATLLGTIGRYQDKIWNLQPDKLDALERYLSHAMTLFGISLELPEIPEKIIKIAREREGFRSNKQFVQSDALRTEINGLGYDIEDTPKGPFVWPR